MHHSTSSYFVLTLIAGFVLDGVRTTSSAQSETTQTRNGTIEMWILGTGDDVRFFVDGKQIGARKRTASWHAAGARIEVPAGEHNAEAQFRIPGRVHSGEWYRLSTREPLVVTPGSVTRLDADVRSAGDTPNDIVRYFEVHSSPSNRAVGAQRGRISAASAAGEKAPVPTITIRGADVVSDGKAAGPLTSSAATDPLDVGTSGLPNDELQVTELSPPSAEAAVVQTGRIEVTLLVQSVPSGAETSLDGKALGKTPLHVQLDPRQDHLLTVAHDGCESIVQLVSTDAWRAGRSPQTLVHLKCK